MFVGNVRWTLDVRFALGFVTFLPAVDLRAALGDPSVVSAAGALLRGLPGLFAGLPGINRLADLVGIVGVLMAMNNWYFSGVDLVV